MISFPCPNCDTELEVRDKAAGGKVTCPECEKRVVVPMRSISSKRNERPSPRQRRAPSRRNNTGLIVGGVGGGLVVLVLCAVGLYFLVRSGGDRQQAATAPDNPSPQAQAPIRQPVQEKPVQENKPPEPDGASLAGSALGSGPSGADIHK